MAVPYVDQHGLQGIVTVSYKTYRDTYCNTYQILRYVSLVEKVYHYTPTINTGIKIVILGRLNLSHQ